MNPAHSDPADLAQAAAAHIREGRHEQALALLGPAIATHPADPMLRVAMCAALHRAGRINEIAGHAHAAVAGGLDEFTLGQLLAILGAAGLSADAGRIAEQLTGVAPPSAETAAAIAEALLSDDRYGVAEAYCRAALEHFRGDAGLMRCGAIALRELGDAKGSVESFGALAMADPGNFNTLSSLCFALNCVSGLTQREVFAPHQRYGQVLKAMSPPSSPFNIAPRPGGSETGPLRVALLSPDLGGHSVGSFVGALFDHLDRSRIRLSCFFTGRADERTRALKAKADAWFEHTVEDPLALGHAIANDRTQVLIELSGHTQGTALPLLAIRVAPVQATWLGYPNTTGAPNLDYRLVDEVTDPPGAESFATERLVRLPGCFVCYAPPEGAPEPGPALPPSRPPAFGSFNALRKISPATLDAWGAVLRACPDWRLVLKAAGLADALVRQRLIGEFSRRRIDAARLDLRPWAGSRRDHLAAYHDVDIALDTFPYNGTTTTCEALFMGVPVVTFTGKSHAGRVGASLLAAAGAGELCASNVDAFVAAASGLARDAERLRRLHAELRPRMLASRLCDGPAFARAFADAVEEMWAGKAGR